MSSVTDDLLSIFTRDSTVEIGVLVEIPMRRLFQWGVCESRIIMIMRLAHTLSPIFVVLLLLLCSISLGSLNIVRCVHPSWSWSANTERMG